MASVYQVITDRLLSMLEQGVCPWRQSWSSHLPTNLISKKPYRGVNRMLLASTRYESPYFLTYNQARSLGGSVKRGERGLPVIFWSINEEIDLDGRLRKDFILRYYTVFNIAQCERVPAPPTVSAEPFDPIATCDLIVDGYRDRPRIDHGGGRAAYVPSEDLVMMPKPESFETPAAYYATLFHELAHSTGSERRLARFGVTDPIRFASHDYAKEELIAEMTAAFLCADGGISASVLPASASYLQGWLKKLRSEPRWLVEAGAAAERAAEWILGRVARADEREPAQAA